MGIMDNVKQENDSERHTNGGAGVSDGDTSDGASGSGPVTIPILRTFHNDRSQITRSKGGAELRSLLAKEMEERKIAQETYKKDVRNLMKESVHLRQRRDETEKKYSGADDGADGVSGGGSGGLVGGSDGGSGGKSGFPSGGSGDLVGGSGGVSGVPPGGSGGLVGGAVGEPGGLVEGLVSDENTIPQSVAGATEYMENIHSHATGGEDTAAMHAVRVGGTDEVLRELEKGGNSDTAERSGAAEPVFHEKKKNRFGFIRRLFGGKTAKRSGYTVGDMGVGGGAGGGDGASGGDGAGGDMVGGAGATEPGRAGGGTGAGGGGVGGGAVVHADTEQVRNHTSIFDRIRGVRKPEREVFKRGAACHEKAAGGNRREGEYAGCME